MKEIKNKWSLKKQYSEAFSYLKELQIYIFIITGLFFVSSIWAFFNYRSLSFLNTLILDLVLKTQGLNGFELTIYILQNNLSSAFFGFLFGIVLGIFPIINSVLNGVLLGYVLGRYAEVYGQVDLWRLLPHGIFELPAIFISLALGLKLGISIFNRDMMVELKRNFYNGVNIFLFIVFPLLVIAAIVEGILIYFVSS